MYWRRDGALILAGILLVILVGLMGAVTGWSRARGAESTPEAGMMASAVSEN